LTGERIIKAVIGQVDGTPRKNPENADRIEGDLMNLRRSEIICSIYPWVARHLAITDPARMGIPSE